MIMPCVSPDGKPTSSGVAVLKALKDGALSPTDVSKIASQPLFQVRSGLRELRIAGLVEEVDGNYKLSEQGKRLITDAR